MNTQDHRAYEKTEDINEYDQKKIEKNRSEGEKMAPRKLLKGFGKIQLTLEQ